METTIVPVKKSYISQLGDICLKAAAATVGVFGAIAAIEYLSKSVNGNEESKKSED